MGQTKSIVFREELLLCGKRIGSIWELLRGEVGGGRRCRPQVTRLVKSINCCHTFTENMLAVYGHNPIRHSCTAN
jgi:hypothetical protein